MYTQMEGTCENMVRVMYDLNRVIVAYRQY